MRKLQVKILDERIRGMLPHYATQGAAGLDLSACTEGPLTLAPGEHVLIVKVVNNGGPAGFYASLRGLPTSLGPVAFLDPENRDTALADRFRDAWGRERSPTWVTLSRAVEEKRSRVEVIEAEAVPVLVMSELPEPTPTYVLTRGRYDIPDEKRPVSRRPPALFGGALPPGEPNDRLGYAHWLVSRENPLTARVHVNRLWQMIFGTGLVKTSENFGQQSEWPSHPELLDWLAFRFMEQGWSVKSLHREILLSRAYAGASGHDEASFNTDPKNALLWRFPRRRLSAEELRDTLLAISGELDTTPGGAHPFPARASYTFTQHRPFVGDIEKFDTNRRSVYLLQQRIRRHPGSAYGRV